MQPREEPRSTRRVLEQLADEVDGLGRRFGLEHASPRVRLDLREFELGVVGIHGLDLLARWRAYHLCVGVTRVP